MKSYNAYQLKLAMAGIMVLDHLKIIPDFIPDQLSMVFHMVTRCVAVFFAYMLVFIREMSKPICYDCMGRQGAWLLAILC
ncbi:hypothetical protein NQZ98_05055 [Streptococcus suis]|uniref:hypothetical protein n=1 Tax=Streptococcus suis TaxID=1307 RepID=UPI00211BE159|nr:hypothetical protein [Streptococcus suis]UUM46340.1 hypothetical protein NQZ98_05055 [Streptococcus suis]